MRPFGNGDSPSYLHRVQIDHRHSIRVRKAYQQPPPILGARSAVCDSRERNPGLYCIGCRVDGGEPGRGLVGREDRAVIRCDGDTLNVPRYFDNSQQLARFQVQAEMVPGPTFAV